MTTPKPKNDPTRWIQTIEERVAIRPKQPRQEFLLDDHVIAERDGIFFMNKPAGWPTSGRHLHDEECLQHRLMKRAGKMIWAVHQLDGDTSGLNVYVARKELVPRWQKRLRFPEARKEYLAIVHGKVTHPLKLTAPIGKRDDGSWGVSPAGKDALTLVRPVVTTASHSLVQVHLRTGRTHQIRVHMSDAGHPLVGEFWYNAAPCTQAPRHMLHAWRTRFDRAQDPERVLAAVPADMLQVAETLGLAIPETVDGDTTRANQLVLHVPPESTSGGE